jgi:hypothetical protein
MVRGNCDTEELNQGFVSQPRCQLIFNHSFLEALQENGDMITEGSPRQPLITLFRTLHPQILFDLICKFAVVP